MIKYDLSAPSCSGPWCLIPALESLRHTSFPGAKGVPLLQLNSKNLKESGVQSSERTGPHPEGEVGKQARRKENRKCHLLPHLCSVLKARIMAQDSIHPSRSPVALRRCVVQTG